MDSKAKNIVIVLGPTGVGKSAVSLQLAERLDGEIINCDSMQVYRGFDIGTDKLPYEKRQKIPHHLLDVSEPDEQFTAARFIELALAAVQDIRTRGHLPFITGGTGLYLKSLEEGLFPEGKCDRSLREKLEKEESLKGLGFLYNQLSRVDPDYAEKIGENDRIRIIRALEVFQSTGKTMTENTRLTRSPVKGFNLVKIGLALDRERLYENIEKRVDRMFKNGLVEETQKLIKAGVPEQAPPFRALGYSHVLRFLKKEITLEEAVDDMKKDTRHYAKRQMTWFRKTPGVVWFSPSAISDMISHIKKTIAV